MDLTLDTEQEGIVDAVTTLLRARPARTWPGPWPRGGLRGAAPA